MIDSLGSVASSNMVSKALTPDTKRVEKVSERSEEVFSLQDSVSPPSPKAIDEVSISSDAMDIANTMQVIAQAKSQITEDSNVTLSLDAERLNALI